MFRNKRGLKEESERFAKKYKPRNSNVSFDVSAKFFGSEMFFLSLDNIESFDLQSILMKQIQEKKIEAHTMFLDTKILYPTGLGFPLELSAHGMSANKILFDFKNKDNAWSFKIFPSFDISVSAALSVDFQVFKKGVKVSSDVHSATGFDADLIINKGTIENISSMLESFNSVIGNFTNKIVKRSTDSNMPIENLSLTLGIPRSPLDVLQIKYSTSFTHTEPDKEEKQISLKQKKRNIQDQCFEQLLIFGAKICYRADFSSLDYADFSLTLELEKKITFVGTHITNEKQQSLVLVYDTPESKEQHTTKVTASFGLVPDVFGRLEVELSNINKLLALEIGLKNNNKEVTLYLKHSDDSEVTIYKGGVIKSTNEYYPILEVDANGHKESSIAGYKVSGKVVSTGDVYSLENIDFVTPSDDKLNINGKMEIFKDKLFTDLLLNKKISIKSTFDVSGDPGYKIGFFVDESGGELFVASGEVDVQIKTPKNNLIMTSKLEKEKFDSHLVWINNNVKEIEVLLSGKKTPDIVEGSISLEKSGGKSAGITFKIGKERELRGRAFLNRHFIDIKGTLDGNKISGLVKSSSGMEFSFNGLIGDKWTINEHMIDIQGKIKLQVEDNDTNWRLKTTGNNEKYVTEGAVTRNDVEWLAWNVGLQLPSDKPINGKFNLKVQNFITTSITFIFNPRNGKGETSAAITLKGNDKIKLDVKFLSLLPKFEIESSILIGNERYIAKTENVVESNKFSSKNYVSWNNKDKQIELVINGHKKNDEMQGNFELLIPGKEVTGKFIKKQTKNGRLFDVSLKDGKKYGNMNFKTEKHGKASLKLVLESETFKSQGSIQKNENTYSYDFLSGNFHTSASINSEDVLFKLNDLQINCTRGKGSASLSISNNQFYIRSHITVEPNKITFKQESSFENIKTIIVNFEQTETTKIAYYMVNGQKYGLELLYEGNKTNLLISTPTNNSNISIIARIQENKKSAEWSFEIENFLNFSGKHTGSYDLENLNNMHASANIEINKKTLYLFELTTQGEKLVIDIKGEKGNIAKGSVNYAIKQEAHKSYIEGQGELLVGEKRTNANFKVMRQAFLTTQDGESGVKFSFTGNFDDRTTINFVKVTDKEIHGKFCLCDKKTECANVELESREGKILAIIDLKTFDVPYEFDLKSNINKELMFDARLIDKSNKDVYKVSSTISALSQRVNIKLHLKEFFINGDTKIPENGLYGHFKEQIEFGFDKVEKTTLVWTANLAENALKFDFQFIHPQIKTLSVLSQISANFETYDINGKFILDTFDDKSKEIIATFKLEGINSFQADIFSNGLKINEKITVKNIRNPRRNFVFLIENDEQHLVMIKVEGNIHNLVIKASTLNSDILTVTSNSNPGLWKGTLGILGKEHVYILENNEKYFKSNLEIKGVAEYEAIFSPGNRMAVKFIETNGATYSAIVSLEKGHFLEAKVEGSPEHLNKILVS